jgi:hypothetical protein
MGWLEEVAGAGSCENQLGQMTTVMVGDLEMQDWESLT